MKQSKPRYRKQPDHKVSNHSNSGSDMLSHPNGLSIFMKKSAELQTENQLQRDVDMLRKPIQFKNMSMDNQGEQSDISTDSDNPERKNKFKKCVKRLLKYVNQKPVIYEVPQSGQQMSQFDDDVILVDFIEKCEKKKSQKDKASFKKDEKIKPPKRNQMLTEYEKEDLIREQRMNNNRNNATDKKRAFFLEY